MSSPAFRSPANRPYRQFWVQATPTVFRAFLEKRGLQIPPSASLIRSRYGTSYWLIWQGKDRLHTAHYTTQHGQPLLLVDEQSLPVSRAEMVAAGLGYETNYER